MDKLLTPKETSKFLGVREITLAIWRSEGKGPNYIKVGGSVRYSLLELKCYLTKNTIKVNG